MNNRELKKQFNILSEKIKSSKEIGFIKSTSPKLFEEQNRLSLKIMKRKNVH